MCCNQAFPPHFIPGSSFCKWHDIHVQFSDGFLGLEAQVGRCGEPSHNRCIQEEFNDPRLEFYAVRLAQLSSEGDVSLVLSVDCSAEALR